LLVAASALAAPLATIKATLAQAPQEPQKVADFLFVQTAKSILHDGSTGKLTLQGVAPVTLFFSDSPERIAGNMQTDTFVPFWISGKNSFLSVPPNADLSLLEGDKLLEFGVVLQDPALQGDSLSYTVKVLRSLMPSRNGETSSNLDFMPDAGDNITVFIDVIGMPLSMLSYPDVARGLYRRATM
jgi:hypothetical protein